MLAYSVIVAFEVVFSGEHYVVDVLAALLVASFLAVMAHIRWASLVENVRAAAARRAARRRMLVPDPTPAPAHVYGGDRGQTLIEFAFIAPLIFLFLFVIVDFGIALDRRITLQHAVREGARYGAVTANVTGIKQTTVNQAQGIVDTSKVTVCYEDTTFDANATVGDVGDSVRVTATFSYEFPILSELWQAFGGSPLEIDMSPGATGRLELSVPGATACGGP